MKLADLEGTVTSYYTMIYLSPRDAQEVTTEANKTNAQFSFTDEVAGSRFNGSSGSFITIGHGAFDASSFRVSGNFKIVDGSQTGDLATLFGKGSYGRFATDPNNPHGLFSELVMLFQKLVTKLRNPYVVALSLGLTSNSFFFHSNLGASIFGIQPSLKGNVDSVTALKLNSWPSSRLPLIMASLTMVSIGPYTMFSMMPINNAVREALHSEAHSRPPQDNWDLVAQWSSRHSVRTMLGGISLAIGTFVAVAL
ncbi:hypothetical protein EX895_000282 [Sporisorium graminicola]|uniref:DUF1772 domain-containing protein n=1 Tax=Sporisorium graminicola TaxID=280036 RepID=A0A4U7KZG2_9BASI|nr:hypothetical protein EX895_000282 [Sporisorium graminicola]TKY90284.1 hypothetical protein EX895_000282 [Sporisorium graminicola]